VARDGNYPNAEKTASGKSDCGAGSCSIVQNGDGTRAEKWHRSDTGSSLDVPDCIAHAATWYADNRDACPRPIIPTLADRFGLSSIDAIAAIRLANGAA
jgi:hypothetical protein